MRRPMIATAVAAVAVAVAFTMTFNMERAHAAGGAQVAPPADDCWTAQNGITCEHFFKDGSKCVVFIRAGAQQNSAMECRITQNSTVPDAPSLTVG